MNNIKILDLSIPELTTDELWSEYLNAVVGNEEGDSLNLVTDTPTSECLTDQILSLRHVRDSVHTVSWSISNRAAGTVRIFVDYVEVSSHSTGTISVPDGSTLRVVFLPAEGYEYKGDTSCDEYFCVQEDLSLTFVCTPIVTHDVGWSITPDDSGIVRAFVGSEIWNPEQVHEGHWVVFRINPEPGYTYKGIPHKDTENPYEFPAREYYQVNSDISPVFSFDPDSQS